MDILTTFLIFLITLGLTYFTHECGHFLFDKMFSECRPKFIIQKRGLRTCFAVRAEIPKELFPIIRENPSKFVVNRNFSRAVGVIGVIPIFIAELLFLELKLLFDPLIFLFLVYSLWETAHLNHDYLNEVFSDASNINS